MINNEFLSLDLIERVAGFIQNKIDSTCNNTEYVGSYLDSEQFEGIDVISFVTTSVQVLEIEESTLILAVIYLDRLSYSVNLNYTNVFFAFLLAILLAFCYWNDGAIYFNSLSQIMGIQLNELRSLQLRFLESIDWRLYISSEDFEKFRTQIM